MRIIIRSLNRIWTLILRVCADDPVPARSTNRHRIIVTLVMMKSTDHYVTSISFTQTIHLEKGKPGKINEKWMGSRLILENGRDGWSET